MNEPTSRPMTPAEVGRLFRVDQKTVTRWIKQGKLPAFRTLGGHYRIERAVVAALYERQDGDG